MDFFGITDINTFIRTAALSVVPFMFAITVHEVMHGYVAYRLGDPTAKMMGRLTLNPIAHIDVMGLLFLLITRMFGWAKPVPVNFYNIRHKYGMALVAAAGPLSNLALAILSVLLIKLLATLTIQFSLPSSIMEPLILMTNYSIQINIALFVFNLLPILPLDGGRIVNNFLPREMAYKYEQTERYGFVIVLLLFISGAIGYIMSPVLSVIYSIVNNIIF